MEKKSNLINLISGNLNSDQRDKLVDEIKADNQLREDYEKIKNAWALSSSQKKMDKQQVESSYLRFEKKNRKSKTRLLPIMKMVRYAAILLIIFSLGIVLGRFIDKNSLIPGQQTTLTNEIHVPNGEKAELTLSDGSIVWLNSGTTFRFPQTFDSNSRNVSISGEAFFKVQKGKIPFIVSSDYGDIKVLGTSFNVRAYSDLGFQATLVEGKINFKTSQTEISLKPGQQILLADDNQPVVKNVDPQSACSWKDGVISFENEPLIEVMRKLERHFNIKVELDPMIASIKFRGKVYNESIYEVMEYINKTKPITYVYDKKQKVLRIKSES